MKNSIVFKATFLAIFFTGVSCKNEVKDEQPEKAVTSGILTQYMDTLVNPGDNFTAYVNGTWVKTPKYRPISPRMALATLYMKNLRIM